MRPADYSHRLKVPYGRGRVTEFELQSTKITENLQNITAGKVRETFFKFLHLVISSEVTAADMLISSWYFFC